MYSPRYISSEDLPPVLSLEEQGMLLGTIKGCIALSPITSVEIKNVIQLAAQLSTYGCKATQVLSDEVGSLIEDVVNDRWCHY